MSRTGNDCATATTSTCIAHGNPKATMSHYGARNDLCPITMDALEARSNLPTATNLISKQIQYIRRP